MPQGKTLIEFRRKHLPAGSRHCKVLDAVAKRAGWGSPLPEGTGRGIAIVESFGTIVAEVIEASVHEDGSPKVLKAWAVVDCGTTVNPLNAEAQIAGGLIMGLSSAIGEAITLDKGAVVQSNFNDYEILKLADAPPMIDVHFIESGAKMGGIGEPGFRLRHRRWPMRCSPRPASASAICRCYCRLRRKRDLRPVARNFSAPGCVMVET